ncbi:MAG: GNAT family N-acetyltransferase [Nocardioidaceae bacterium]
MEQIRPASAADVPAIAALYRSLSHESAQLRFSGMLPEGAADEIAALGPGTLALLAEEGGRLVGEGRYCVTAGVPELALTIRDDHQGHGLGRRLLDALREAAREHGFDRMTAVVRTDNPRMIRLLQRVGCVIVEPVRDAVVVFEVGTDELMPSWPAGSRPRVLVESGSLFDDAATEALRAAGYDVRRCLVGRAGRSCPLVRLGRCRLAEEADVVACLAPAGEGPEIAARHAAARHLTAASMPEWRRAVPGLVEAARLLKE